jgi:hypothetical protein
MDNYTQGMWAYTCPPSTVFSFHRK